MRWILIVGMLAGCAGLAQEPGTGDGGQCSCPAGPPGPQGPKGDPGEPGPSGGDGPGTDSSKSGSRLRYLGKTLRGSDGSAFAQQGAFFDEELGMECSPGLAEDGKLRCLPIQTWLTSGYFVDAGCTQAVTRFRKTDCGGLSSETVFSQTVGECGQPVRFEIFRVKAEAHQVFMRSGGDCIAADADEWRAFHVDKMPSSTFVSFD